MPNDYDFVHDTMRCVITFKSGETIYNEVKYIDENYEYVDDWYNSGKTTKQAKDIKSVRLLTEDEAVTTSHKHIKDI